MREIICCIQWLWCVLVLSTGPGYLLEAVSVPVPPQPQPKGPATVEAQAKYFQDFFSVQLSPYKLEFGHVCEDPNTWEQRYEHKDLKNFRDMGKVRWGDKHGGYGEHYWDLNHAGSTNNNARADDNNGDHKDQDHEHDYEYKHDDGSYDDTVEKGNYNPNYGEGDEYNAEKLAKGDYSEEISRAKRAHPKIRAEKRLYVSEEDDNDNNSKNNSESDEDEKEEDEVLAQEIQKTNLKSTRKSKRQHKPAIKELNLEEDPEEEQVTSKPKIRKSHKSNENQNTQEETQNQEQEKNQRSNDAITRVVNEIHQPRQGRTVFNPYRADVQRINQNYGARNFQDHYVPYEGDVRQHQGHQDVSGAASTPFRLFLEPSTGHVIDRATGLAYVLQPVAPVTNFGSYN